MTEKINKNTNEAISKLQKEIETFLNKTINKDEKQIES